MVEVNYTAVPTLSRFHQSKAFYRGVMGPVRSGKSTGMSIELMRRAIEQGVWSDKVRRSRFVIVRNTYMELTDTTLKTWLMWFPEDIFGKFNYQKMSHRINQKLPDGTVVDTEVMFRALDRPEDVRKLLSMEVTGGWINEAREVPKAVVDVLGDRVGQYPPKSLGGCTWSGVMMDTNPPDDDHWWYRLAEVERPDGWDFFRQPGALVERDGKYEGNVKAENIGNLNEGIQYYLKRVSGKKKDYIRVYYCGEYGFVIDGKPVVPEYMDSIHCPEEEIKPVQGLPVYIGIDFGLTPAAVFTQKMANGRWLWIDELCTEDMGISRFADILKPKLAGEYGGFQIEIYGDPAGEQRAQTDEQTPFQILEAKGIDASPAPTNDFTVRRESIAVPLTRFFDGKPGLLVSPKCKLARKGLAGGYCYRRMQVSGDERYHDKPVKTRYSHAVDAGGYAMLGAGEGVAITTGNRLKVHIPGTARMKEYHNISTGWMAA